MDDLPRRIEAEIPRLRRYARALCRSEPDADDLVQECILRALTKRHLWQEGTDLRAWLFTILHNLYVNNVRRLAREGSTVGVGDLDQETQQIASQDKRFELRDLDRALALLPQEQKVLIFLVGLEGMDYATAAQVVGVPSPPFDHAGAKNFDLDGHKNPTAARQQRWQERLSFTRDILRGRCIPRVRNSLPTG
jgi:RNA polymerase sigma-70 factor, ECF subfamily